MWIKNMFFFNPSLRKVWKVEILTKLSGFQSFKLVIFFLDFQKQKHGALRNYNTFSPTYWPPKIKSLGIASNMVPKSFKPGSLYLFSHFCLYGRKLTLTLLHEEDCGLVLLRLHPLHQGPHHLHSEMMKTNIVFYKSRNSFSLSSSCLGDVGWTNEQRYVSQCGEPQMMMWWAPSAPPHTDFSDRGHSTGCSTPSSPWEEPWAD